MDITQAIVSRRNEALVVGDYGTYRKQLSRRLLVVRRKLGCASPKGREYKARAAITAEDVSGNPQFVDLLLLRSERAWAHAMYMKSMHSASSSSTTIRGSTRTHIVSRLQKAAKTATHLVELLRNLTGESGHSQVVLEGRAYLCTLQGSLAFESQRWERCLRANSEAHLIYKTLAKRTNHGQGDVHGEFLSSTVDPSIRYAAYQLRLPRTLPIAKIVSRFVPRDAEDVQEILRIDPSALDEGGPDAKGQLTADGGDLPREIQWRSYTAKLEDARIAQALAAVYAAEKSLASFLSSASSTSLTEQAAAYDGVLTPSQDAVDATKTAIDELSAEGVSQGDKRMEALQITRTAVNYALIGWRIGRNRILCGRADGAYLDPIPNKARKSRKDSQERKAKDESTSRKLTRLRERVVLYDNTLQSIGPVEALPGVAADAPLLEELNRKKSYFSALRCLAIARAHSFLDNKKNALALLNRASTFAAQSISPKTPARSDKPLNFEVTSSQTTSLQHLLHGLVSQHRALVELENLQAEVAKAEKSRSVGATPLLERLDEYPLTGADLSNLVIYPPRLRPVPVKPLFLDVAWNYIEYPGRSRKVEVTGVNGVAEKSPDGVEEKKEARRGWFGFGR